MKIKSNKFTNIFLIFFLIFSICSMNTTEAIGKDSEIKKYILEGDPFERSFIGGIKQRLTMKMDNLKNKRDIIYQNSEVDKITINGATLKKEDIVSNIQEFKKIYMQRNKDEGLKNIKVTTADRAKYDYDDYLKLKSKNTEPMNITSNTTWTKEKGPYYIGGEVRVIKGVTLTIEEGTEVYFYDAPITNGKSGILVDGDLVINGTKGNEVNLRPLGENKYGGSWKGIYITERGSLEANYTNIEKAGAWSESGIYSIGNLTLNNCSITDTLGNGITAFRNVKLDNNNISNNTNYGLDISRSIKDYDTIITNNTIKSNDIAGKLSFNDSYSSNYNVINNTVSDNNTNGFKLSGKIIGKTTFTDIGKNAPYILHNVDEYYNKIPNFTVKEDANVTFNKCVVKVEDNPNTYNRNTIEVDGKLNLVGDSSKPVVFTSIKDNSVYGDTTITDSDEVASNKDWAGISVSKSGNLAANYLNISYSTKAISSLGETTVKNSNIKNTIEGIYVYNQPLSISNSNFDKVYKYAFNYDASNKAAELTLNNNIFQNIDDVVGKIGLEKSGGDRIIASNNTTYNNAKNGVKLTGNINIDIDIKNIANNLPYIVPYLNILQGTEVNIEPGTVLKIEDGILLGSKSGIINNGVLNLNGTSSNRVVVTSLKDDSVCGDTNGDGTSKGSRGDWGSISYKGKNLSNITYADIKYGGDLKDDFMVGGSGALTIKNSNIKHSSQNGIRATGNGNLQVSSSNISYNSKNGIKSSGNATVNSSTISNNDMNGVEVDKILNILSSNIQNNKNHGIEASGELDLNNSNISANGKHGLNIINENGSNFKLNLVGNTFRDNKEYAAFSKFNHDDDRITGNNNIGINNSINGIGITGEIGANVTLEPAGDKFPFVVPEFVKVKEGKTVTLLEGLTMKFWEDAKFDLAGNIDVKGTDSDKVTFTSLKDDSIAGDTNNDQDASKPPSSEDDNKYYDWVGIEYNAGSEATINRFECKYSKFNMDYDLIKNVEADLKGDNKVSTDGSKSVFIRKNNSQYEAMLYNHTTKESKVLNSTSSKKSGIMISGNYVAWVEENRIVIYNLTLNTIQKTIDDDSITDMYLNDGYIVWLNGGTLKYTKLGVYNINKIENVSNDFSPVISSKYILYKDSKNNGMYNLEIGSNKKYKMITNMGEHIKADIYGENIAFLSKNPVINSYNIIVGDIPSWSAKQVTDNVYSNNNNISLYKDKISYFNVGNKNIVIRESGDSNGNSKVINDQFTQGYYVLGNSIGEKSSIFADEKLVYSINTDIATKSSKFITGDRYNKPGYNRDLQIGNSMDFSLGGELGEFGIEGGIKLSLGKSGNITYNLEQNTVDDTRYIGLSRERIYKAGIEGEFELGKLEIGKGKVGLSSSLGREVSTLKTDSYKYDAQSIDAYRQIGLLTGSTIVNSINQYRPIEYIIGRVLDAKISEDSREKSIDYDRGAGVGMSVNHSTNLGLDINDIETPFEAGISIDASGLGKVGETKSKGKYIETTFGYESDISAGVNVELSLKKEFNLDKPKLKKEPYKLNAAIKMPDFPLGLSANSKLNLTTKLNENGELSISFSDGKEDNNGNVKTYTYIIKGDSYKYAKSNNLFNLSDLKSNMSKIQGDDSLIVESFTIEENKGIVQMMVDLLKVALYGEIEYYITMTNDTEFSLPKIEIDTDRLNDLYPGIKPTVDATVDFMNTVDTISLEVDSGIIRAGKVSKEDVRMAFIPEDKDTMVKILKNIFAAFVEQISPDKIYYGNDGIATYNKDGYKVDIIRGSGEPKLTSSLFIRVPMDIKDNNQLELEVSENDRIITDSLYIASMSNGKEITQYPQGTELKMYVPSNKWSENKKYNYAIYRYDPNTNNDNEEVGKWIKLGGKIDESTKSIALDISGNSVYQGAQYAIGYDISAPNIKWSKDGRIIDEYTEGVSGLNVLQGDRIDVELIADEIDTSTIKVNIFGNEINKEYYQSSKNISYTINEEPGIYYVNISFEDIFKNKYEERIKLIVKSN